MCARFTVLSDTPMAAEIAGCVIATLTQQHHLDALALRSRYLPPQRSLQPPHLGFAAFCHLCSPESDGASESQLRCGNQPGLNCLPNLDSSRYGVGNKLTDPRPRGEHFPSPCCFGCPMTKLANFVTSFFRALGPMSQSGQQRSSRLEIPLTCTG